LSGVAAEAALIAIFALAAGKDVTQAAGTCSTAYDCSLACVNEVINGVSGSQKVVQNKQRYATGGTAALACGTNYIYSAPGCPSNYLWTSSTASCPAGTCCS